MAGKSRFQETALRALEYQMRMLYRGLRGN